MSAWLDLFLVNEIIPKTKLSHVKPRVERYGSKQALEWNIKNDLRVFHKFAGSGLYVYTFHSDSVQNYESFIQNISSHMKFSMQFNRTCKFYESHSRTLKSSRWVILISEISIYVKIFFSGIKISKTQNINWQLN